MTKKEQENKCDKIENCVLCEIIYAQLKEDGELISHFSQTQKDALLKHFKVNSAVGYCRGVGLCSKHMSTIKRDNKYRVLKKQTIPKDLSLFRRLQYPDI